MIYIHFTDFVGATEILLASRLYASMIVDGVYAVHVGGALVPSVQQTNLGRAKNRDFAVMFTTAEEPDVQFPEETIWRKEYIDIQNGTIITREQAEGLLDPNYEE